MTDFIFLASQITVDSDCSHEIKWCFLLGRKVNLDKPRQHIKKQRHHFTDKGVYSRSYGFSHNNVWKWKLDHKEGWALKNWCFSTVVLDKTPESPFDCKKTKTVKLKLKLQYFYHSLEKTLMLGKTEDQRSRRDEMVRQTASLAQWTWIWANYGREWRTRELVCCSPGGCKELD